MAENQVEGAGADVPGDDGGASRGDDDQMALNGLEQLPFNLGAPILPGDEPAPSSDEDDEPKPPEDHGVLSLISDLENPGVPEADEVDETKLRVRRSRGRRSGALPGVRAPKIDIESLEAAVYEYLGDAPKIPSGELPSFGGVTFRDLAAAPIVIDKPRPAVQPAITPAPIPPPRASSGPLYALTALMAIGLVVLIGVATREPPKQPPRVIKTFAAAPVPEVPEGAEIVARPPAPRVDQAGGPPPEAPIVDELDGAPVDAASPTDAGPIGEAGPDGEAIPAAIATPAPEDIPEALPDPPLPDPVAPAVKPERAEKPDGEAPAPRPRPKPREKDDDDDGGEAVANPRALDLPDVDPPKDPGAETPAKDPPKAEGPTPPTDGPKPAEKADDEPPQDLACMIDPVNCKK